MKKDLMDSTKSRHAFIKNSLQNGGFETVDRYFDLLDGISYTNKYNEIYKNDLNFYNTQMKKMYGGAGVWDSIKSTVTGKKNSPNVARQKAETAIQTATNTLTQLNRKNKLASNSLQLEINRLKLKTNPTNATKNEIKKLEGEQHKQESAKREKERTNQEKKQKANYEKQQQNEQKRQENQQRERQSNRRGYEGSQYRPPQRQSFGEYDPILTESSLQSPNYSPSYGQQRQRYPQRSMY
jgi:hypothetical protein